MPALHSLSISVHTDNLELVDDACHSSLECAANDPVSLLLLVAGSILLFLLFITAVIHLKKASNAVNEERSRTAEESDALAEFIRRVKAIEPTTPKTNPMVVGGPSVVTSPDSFDVNGNDYSLEELQTAYRDTMMAVPHYDEDYDESLFVNMAAEFGTDIATAVSEGAEFTPQLKSAIVEKSRESHQQRVQLLSGLRTEADQLRAAQSTARSINQSLDQHSDSNTASLSYNELISRWHRLCDLEQSCSDFLQDRQQHIHSREVISNSGLGNLTFNEYLYGSLPVVHPVLVSFTELNTRIRETKQSIIDTITRRV